MAQKNRFAGLTLDHDARPRRRDAGRGPQTNGAGKGFLTNMTTNGLLSPGHRVAAGLMLCVLVWSGAAAGAAPPVAALGNTQTSQIEIPDLTDASSLAFMGPDDDEPAEYAGVWRLRGLAGKCLDVGGYPTGHSSQVILYDCNSTKAQHITFVPLVNPEYGYEYELRAHGRCLTVQGGVYETDTPIVLTPCDNSQSQRFFFVSQTHITPTATLWDPRLVVTVRGANSANHTPLVLAPATQQPNAAGRWGRQQVDTTPYDWARVVATAGAYAFKAFGTKCIDIGGAPHPEHSPAFLNDCNGTLAQSFKLRPVDEHLGHYNITVLDTPELTSNPLTPKGHAVDRCLDIDGGTPSAGAHVELNACSGATSQRFAFDNFDRQYIYPAGTPELAIGLAGVRKENGALLELQTRATVASQDWRPIPVEHQVIGPKAPAIRFGKLRTVDHRDGTDVVYYTPLLMVRDDAALDANYEMFWKRLGGNEYAHRALSGVSTGIGQILNGRLPEIRSGVYVAKARATAANGLFSESPEITIDARGLELFSLTIQGVDDDGATVRWQAAGTPRVSRFDVRFRPVGVGQTLEWQVAAEPGTGMANVTYQKQAVNLQPNTMYEVSVSAHSDLWSERSAATSTMTLPSPSTDPPPPPPPPPVSGISRVNVFNCVDEGGPVHVWTRDIAQSFWVERGSAPSLWNGSSCPGSAAPFGVQLEDGHSFWFVVVDPQLPGCGGQNDPGSTFCQKSIFTQPLTGDADGPALPLLVY